MNLEQYMELAPRTYTGEKLEILTLGFIGEPGELLDLLKKESRGKEIKREQWLEELGDAYWYPVVWCHVHGQSFMERMYRSERGVMDNYGIRANLRYMTYSGLVIDECDEMGYGSYAVANARIENYLANLKHVREKLGFTLEEVFEYNIVKLMNRYPQCFEGVTLE